jgi:hypothetical protein
MKLFIVTGKRASVQQTEGLTKIEKTALKRLNGVHFKTLKVGDKLYKNGYLFCK